MSESYAMKMNRITKESPKHQEFCRRIRATLDRILDDVQVAASNGEYRLSLSKYDMDIETYFDIAKVLRGNGFQVDDLQYVNWRNVDE